MVASIGLDSFPVHLLTIILVSLFAKSFLLSNILHNIIVSLVPNILLRKLPVKLHLQRNSIPSLPEDLSRDILLRLPVKSLLRFKLVCKEWNTIITSSSFIKKHFNDDSNTTSLAIYLTDFHPDIQGPSFCICSYFDETLEKQHDIPDNLLLGGHIIFFRGPCTGIYCLYIEKNKFALWNPTTRRFRFIQCCSSHIFDEVGFGIDPLTNDFKIVLIRGMWAVSPCFAVYTSSSDSWKYLEQESVGDSEAYICERKRDGDTYLNGFYYWIKRKRIGVRNFSLVAFDMHNEFFEETTMPEVARNEISLHLLNDSLALVSFDPYYYEDLHVEIWLMEGKGRWTKFLSVFPPFICLNPTGFWGRNKMLVFGAHNGTKQLLEYDLDSHTTRQVTIEYERVGLGDILPIFFKESLLSLKDKDGIQDYDTRSAEALEYLGYKGPISDQLELSYKGPICTLIHGTFQSVAVTAARDDTEIWHLDGDEWMYLG